MNICLICEASLSHHTLYMGNFGPRVHVSIWPPKNGKRLPSPKKAITAPILKPIDDQKPETLLGALLNLKLNKVTLPKQTLLT